MTQTPDYYEKIKESFAEFYKDSPFPGRTLTPEQAKIAMEGSYIAGCNWLLQYFADKMPK